MSIICTHDIPFDRQREILAGWHKDYFCPECKWFVGYFSRLIWRTESRKGSS